MTDDFLSSSCSSGTVKKGNVRLLTPIKSLFRFFCREASRDRIRLSFYIIRTHITQALPSYLLLLFFIATVVCVLCLSHFFLFSPLQLFSVCAAHLSLLGAPVMAAGHWDDVNEETSAADTRSETPKGRTHLLFSSVCIYMCCRYM